jgi:hypothetical protein
LSCIHLFIAYLYEKQFIMRRKKVRIVLFVLAGIVLLLIVVAIGVHTILPQRIQKRLHQELFQALEQQQPGLYRIELEGVSFSPLLRRLKVASLKIEPDNQQMADASSDSLPRQIFRLDASDLVISTKGIIDVVREKSDIVFSRLGLQELSVYWISNADGFIVDTDSEEPSWSPQSVHIRRLDLGFSSMENLLLADTSTRVMSMGAGKFSGNIQYHFGSGEDAPTVNIREHTLAIATIAWQPPGDLYRYSCDSLAMTGDDQSLELFGVHMDPLYDKYEFQSHLSYQTDRVDARIENVSITGFDLEKMVNQEYFFAEKLDVNGGDVEVFRGRTPPLDTERRPKLPSRLIKEAPIQIYLGSVVISGLDMVYQELPEDSAAEGEVSFIDLSASISNITNVPEMLQQDSIMRINTRANMFGGPALQAAFHYNLQDINGGYRAQGTLESMSFELINQALYPLTGMLIAGGHHQHTQFSFSGNDFRSTGVLTMRYSGLELNLEPERSDLRRSITNWAGRTMVYHKDNPREDKEPREGEMDFERDPSRFVFHYWWNTFLTGVRSTVLRDAVDDMI